MEKEQSSYYAIIPANVRYDKRVCANAKLLYGEITALCNKEGYCWASNQYFANLYEVDNRTISRWVQELVRAGHIRFTVENLNTRRIFIVGVGQKDDRGTTKLSRGVRQNCLHNNTVNNTKNITTNTSEHSSQDKFSQLGCEVIKAFESINPVARTWYANKVQRKACDDLIADHGLEKVLRVVNYLQLSNQMPYVPTITTPTQLRDKWASLNAALIKKQQSFTPSTLTI